MYFTPILVKRTEIKKKKDQKKIRKRYFLMRWFKNRFITFIIFFLWESNTFTDNPEIFPLVTPKVQDNNWNSVQFKIKIDQKWQIKESVNRCKL